MKWVLTKQRNEVGAYKAEKLLKNQSNLPDGRIFAWI